MQKEEILKIIEGWAKEEFYYDEELKGFYHDGLIIDIDKLKWKINNT